MVGHSLCMGGARNVTVLSFPPGLYADFPCNGAGARGESGCVHGLDRVNWTAHRAPLLAHRIRRPAFVRHALRRREAAPLVEPQAARCAAMAASPGRAFKLSCGHAWRWCNVPFTPAAPIVPRPNSAKAPKRRP